MQGVWKQNSDSNENLIIYLRLSLNNVILDAGYGPRPNELMVLNRTNLPISYFFFASVATNKKQQHR